MWETGGRYGSRRVDWGRLLRLSGPSFFGVLGAQPAQGKTQASLRTPMGALIWRSAPTCGPAFPFHGGAGGGWRTKKFAPLEEPQD